MGVVVQPLSEDRPLYAHEAETQFVPASNVKIVTTAAALHYLGPDFRFRTEVFGELGPDGVVEGDLYLSGDGDPWLVPERIWYLANRLFYAGVREVRGDLIIDDSFFPGPQFARGRGRDRSSYAYMAPIGAVSAGFNAISVHVYPGKSPGDAPKVLVEPRSEYGKIINRATTSSRRRTRLYVSVVPAGDRSMIVVSGRVAIHDAGRSYWRRIDQPALFAGDVLKTAMDQVGLPIHGRVRRGLVPASASKLLHLGSPRLAELVTKVNKHSNNFMADQIAYALGGHLYGAPGTWEKAKRAVQTFLAERVGIAPDEYAIENASGLHDVNRFTPSQIVRVLRYMHRQPNLRPEFVASLAVASASGTLSSRMRDTEAAGLLRAKTGTLSIASALSGYVTSHDGELLAFSILVNHYRAPLERVWDAQDTIGTLLAGPLPKCAAERGPSVVSRVPVGPNRASP